MDRTSLWQGTADKSVRYPNLQGDLKVDVAIVGAGITGLTIAMLLAQAGKRVAVLEAGQVGAGTSGHSTGNLYAPVDVRMAALEQKWGADALRQVAASRAAAVDLVERKANALKIDCSLVRCPWYLSAAGPDQLDAIRAEFEAAQRAGLPASMAPALSLPVPSAGVLCIDNQAQFQPLDYLRQLAQRISSDTCLVFENTSVRMVEDDPALVHTDTGTVQCDQVVLATHTPIGIHLVQSALEVVREYGVALHVDTALPAGVHWSLGPKNHSIRGFTRRDQHYLVVVGEAHPTGGGGTAQRYGALEEFARQNFACGPLAYRWSTQRYRAKDKLPYIGRNVDSRNTWIATGYSGDGLTYGTLAGMLVADQILGKDNPWSTLYRVDRLDTAKRARGFERESTEAPQGKPAPSLSAADRDRFQDLQPCQARQEKVNGEPVAAWRNDQGELMVVSGRCTHMGCALKWNEAETSWDCPCHGSRFAPDGQVLEGPSIAPLSNLGVPSRGPAQPPGADSSDTGDEL